MVMTAGGGPPSGGVAVAAAGTDSTYLDAGDDREAGAHALSLRETGGGRATASSMLATSSHSDSAESVDYPPLPVFKQSVSSTLTGPGSGSFLMNGNGYNSSSPGGGGGTAAGGAAAKGKGAAGRGAGGGGRAAAAAKDERGKTPRDRGGERARNTGTAGRPVMSLGSSNMKMRSAGAAGAAGAPGMMTPHEGATRGRAPPSAPLGGGGAGSRGGSVGGGGAAAGGGTAETTGETGAGSGGKGGWTTLFRGRSRESGSGETAERRFLIRNHNAGGAAGAATAAGSTEEGGAAAPTATALPALLRLGRRGRRSGAGGGVEQQDLEQQKAGKEQKAKQWIVGGLLIYCVLGILVLYCISYANIEWCCIFVIFGVVVGGMGLYGLRQSSRLLLLIHVGAAVVLLVTLFVAWCYNIYVLLGAIDILLASSWPPLHHQQFKYYYSIPTAYESPPAPWVEEVLLMRLQYPSEDAAGIRKLIGEQEPTSSDSSSSRRRRRKAASTTRTPSSDGTSAPQGAEPPTPAAPERESPRETTASSGGTGEGTGKAAGATAKTQAAEGRDATATTPAAETRGGKATRRRLGSAEETEAAALEQRGGGGAAVVRARHWQREKVHRHGAGETEPSALPWRRRLEETRRASRRRDTWPRLDEDRDESEGGRGSRGAPQWGGWGKATPLRAAVGGDREDTRTWEGYTAKREGMWQQERSRDGLRRRLGEVAAPGAATAPDVPFLPPPRDVPGREEPRRWTPRRRVLPRRRVGAEKPGTKEEEAKRGNEEEAAAEPNRIPTQLGLAAAPRSREIVDAAPAAAGPRPAPAAAAAADPTSPETAEDGSAAGQQLRGSGPGYKQLQEENGEKNEGERHAEEEAQEDVEPAPMSEPRAASGAANSLSSTLSLAAEQAAATGGRGELLEQSSYTERDAKGRELIRGCVEGAERNSNFLNDAARAMSSLATRGWLCAFARAEVIPFHRWPVDCSNECGYAFLDTGHDLHASNYYDMTRVAEYLIQVSSLPPKRMQECVDYAASTVCSIKNRNFFVVWVVLLLFWLLLACIACCGILPFSLYNTVQVIKGLPQP